MATFTLDENQAANQVRSYKPGLIQINETYYTESLILTPEQIISPWPVATSEQLTFEDLKRLIAMRPDIVLIGTGATHDIIPLATYGEFINLGIGVEVMSTSAACRTYNALTAENRIVVAALIV